MSIVSYKWDINMLIVDAFVALGGEPNKEGTISKKTLIEIIKHEFELTIDMEVVILCFTLSGVLNEIGRRQWEGELLLILHFVGCRNWRKS